MEHTNDQAEAAAKESLAAFYTVYNALGRGFLEKVYENALAVELRLRGFTVNQQASIDVFYRGEKIGQYFADLLVNNCLITEIKVAAEISIAHEGQLVNYLKATNFELGLILNFGPRPQIKRKVNSRFEL